MLANGVIGPAGSGGFNSGCVCIEALCHAQCFVQTGLPDGIARAMQPVLVVGAVIVGVTFCPAGLALVTADDRTLGQPSRARVVTFFFLFYCGKRVLLVPDCLCAGCCGIVRCVTQSATWPYVVGVVSTWVGFSG